MNTINHIIYCILDDVSSEYLFKMIKRGELPNLKKLMNDGIYTKNCITDFPSITYPTQVSMITGTYTGDYRKELCHGIPIFNWMERNKTPPLLRSYGSYGYNQGIQIYKLNDDMGTNCRTLLEMVGEGNTASIAQFINRGVTYFFPERKTKLAMYYLLIKYLGNIEKFMARANFVIVKKVLDTFKKPNKFFEIKEPPIGSLLLFFSSDFLMHLYGYDSVEYKRNILHIDKVIGILIKELDKIGYLDDTAIAIAADHGNYKAKEVGDLSSFFNKLGLTHYYPRKNVKGNLNLAEFGSVGFFNFKSKDENFPDRWINPSVSELERYGPKKVNLFKELFKIKGTSLMYYQDSENRYNKGKIYLKKRNISTNEITSGLIEYQGTGMNYKTRYTTEGKDDIFRYGNNELTSKILDNKYHSTEEWLSATYLSDHPLYPDLIPRHFKNPRGSDIVISTEGNITYNIKHGKQKNHNLYLHDIGLRKSAVVPLIIGGSKEIPTIKAPFCKVTDIVPTLLKMIGKKPHISVLGKSLI